MVRTTTRMTGRDMKLTIESMTYGPTGWRTPTTARPSLCRAPWQATPSRPRSYRTASRSCAPAPPRFWSQAPIAFSLPAPSWASAAAARGAISHARHSSPPRSKTCAPRSSASASSLLSRSMSWYSPSATPRTTGATAIKSSSNRPSSTVACVLACTVSTPAKS